MSVRSHPKQDNVKKKRNTPSPEADKHKELILTLHAGGSSTRKIAEATGLSKSYVARLLQRWGILRSKKEAAKIYQDSRIPVNHWRLNRARARKIYQQYHGVKLGKDQVVHHINNDSYDNRIENLMVMTHYEHAQHHVRKYNNSWKERNKERVKAYRSEWGKRPEVRERHNQYKRERRAGTRLGRKK